MSKSLQIQLLDLFLKNPGNILTRQEIEENIWPGVKVYPKNVDVHIYNLRRKISPQGLMIKSVGPNRWQLMPVLKDATL
jgi:DNA-binding response OmpR family regulator